MEDFNIEDLYLKAKQKVDRIRGFYIHLTSYVIVNIAISTWKIIRNLNNGETFSEAFFDFSTFIVWIAWGIGVVFHALAVFSSIMPFARQWEDKKLNQFIIEEEEKLKNEGYGKV